MAHQHSFVDVEEERGRGEKRNNGVNEDTARRTIAALGLFMKRTLREYRGDKGTKEDRDRVKKLADEAKECFETREFDRALRIVHEAGNILSASIVSWVQSKLEKLASQDHDGLGPKIQEAIRVYEENLAAVEKEAQENNWASHRWVAPADMCILFAREFRENERREERRRFGNSVIPSSF